MAHQEIVINDSYEVRRYWGPDLPKQYLNFILAKWLRSYRHGNEYIKLIDADCYFLAYSPHLRGVLGKHNTIVRLATLADDDDVALGFSVIQHDTLHYVYVHKDLRRHGIGRKLIPVSFDSFTHLTKTGLLLWSSKCPNAKFNPFGG